MSGLAVSATDEFMRIASIPRRDPNELLRDTELHAAATRALRAANADGSRSFRPIQAAGLVSAARSVELGSPGAFLPIGVGEGKTDISFCLPLVLQATRAVLTVPGKLTTSKATKLGKTERDFRVLRAHWQELPFGQILSYERLGRAGGGKILEAYSPDLVVSDEAHSLRNREGAACARVVEHYVRSERAKGRRVLWVVLSGTMTGGSIIDMAHLAELSLGEARTFLPVDAYDLDMWRRAVDAEVEMGGRVDPGVLLDMPHETKGTKMQRARSAIQRRMHETEGVIASREHGIKASLRFDTLPDCDTVGEQRWYDLRKEWLLPNGEQCLDGFEYHRHAREYADGYWTEWDPPPPPEWRKRRKAWAKIAHGLVSERVVNTEVEAREYVRENDSDAAELLDAWLAIRDSYNPDDHRVARWLSDATLEACAAWASQRKSGIIWTQHVPFGERLERDFGIPYYREEGLNAEGEYIENASGIICASIQANFEGRNLQFKWSANLFPSPYGSAQRNEQNLGRTHRQLQPADVVTVEYRIGCLEHLNALKRARERAAAIEQLTKNPQKLCYGDWTRSIDELVRDYKSRPGSQWKPTIKDEDDQDEDKLFALLTEGLTEGSEA